MQNGEIIEKLVALFGQGASVKNVYGEPVRSGEKTIIPVAKVAYALGGGHGEGSGKRKGIQPGETDKPNNPVSGEGEGGGGAMYTKGIGVYEITPTSTRFIPASRFRTVAAGILTGFIIRGLFDARRKCSKKR